MIPAEGGGIFVDSAVFSLDAQRRIVEQREEDERRSGNFDIACHGVLAGGGA